MYEQSHRDYLALVICIIVCLSWAVNRRDNAITYKAPARQKCRTESTANAAITDMQMRPAWCCLRANAKYTKELADAKAENDALRDDVAAGRRHLHIKAVCRIVREIHASGVDNAASPTGRHRWTGLFHPQREADHYAKMWKDPEVY